MNGGERREQVDRKVPEQAFQTVMKDLKAADRLKRPPGAVVQGRPVLGPRVVGTAPLKATAVAAGALSSARASMNVEASRLSQARSEGLGTQEEKLTGRMLDLIVKELTIELSGSADVRTPPLPSSAMEAEGRRSPKQELPNPAGALKPDAGAAQQQGLQQPQPAQQVSPAVKAQSAVELVRRIETFLKSDRPSLALTIAGALSAHVEVERTGKGEVALRVQGTRGPPPAEDISRIREALHARGLKVSSLSVG